MKDRHALLFAGVALAAVAQAFDGFVTNLFGMLLVGFGVVSTIIGDYNGE